MDKAAFLFAVAFAGLLGHELDAVHKREWRLLYILRTMSDDAARPIFILLHVPLLAVLLLLLSHATPVVSSRTRYALNLFMLVHAGLHWRLSHDERYGFHPWYSQLLIYGSAASAGGDILLLYNRMGEQEGQGDS